MDGVGATNNEESKMSRISYVEQIIQKIESSSSFFPAPKQDRFYQEALLQLSGALSSNGEEIGGRTFSNDIFCKTRKESLKAILGQLRGMERIRLYGPPSEDELGFYQNIKHHVWSIFAFAGAKHTISSSNFDETFSYYTPFVIVPYLENFGELNRHLKDIILSVSDSDITNGLVMKPFIGMKTDREAVPMPFSTVCKKRSNMFYRHKFMLALLDLFSAHILDSPPTGDEKRAYQNILDNVSPTSSCDATTVSGEPSKHKHTDFDSIIKMLLEQVPEMIDELVGHFQYFFHTIFSKLCINYESLDNVFKCSPAGYDCMVREFVRNCEATEVDFKGYVHTLDEALIIAKYITSITEGIVYAMNTLKKGRRTYLEPVRALTILNCSGEYVGKMFEDRSKLLDQSKKDEEEKLMAFKPEGSCSVKILQDILLKLREIGYSDLNSKLDEEEIQLLANILKNAASSVDFFFSAITYAQQSTVFQHVNSPDEIQRCSMEFKKLCDLQLSRDKEKLHRICFDSYRFISILSAYKIGLVNNASAKSLCLGLMVSEQDKLYARRLKL